MILVWTSDFNGEIKVDSTLDEFAEAIVTGKPVFAKDNFGNSVLFNPKYVTFVQEVNENGE